MSTMKPIETSEYLSKYEFARIVGLRALQIVSDVHVSESGEKETPHKRAMREVAEGKLAWCVRRYLPNGSHEDCDIRNLKVDTSAIVL